jgi:hypothetical protein
VKVFIVTEKYDYESPSVHSVHISESLADQEAGRMRDGLSPDYQVQEWDVAEFPFNPETNQFDLGKPNGVPT